MYRDDAQMVQQAIGGEMPVHLNRPGMTVILQFKQAAILANKKQLTRSMQFADKEAALGVMLNAAIAGVTRTAKFGTLGAAAYAVTGNESDLVNPLELDYLDPEKYVTPFGIIPDVAEIGTEVYKFLDEDKLEMTTASAGTIATGIANQLPMAAWMRDYYGVARGIADRDAIKTAEHTKGVALMGTMQWADIFAKGLEQQLRK